MSSEKTLSAAMIANVSRRRSSRTLPSRRNTHRACLPARPTARPRATGLEHIPQRISDAKSSGRRYMVMAHDGHFTGMYARRSSPC